MIEETKRHACRKCGSLELVRNGQTKAGKQKFKCKDCHSYGTLELSTPRYPDETKEQILAAYHEWTSQRGIRRIFGVSRDTLRLWLKKNSPGC